MGGRLHSPRTWTLQARAALLLAIGIIAIAGLLPVAAIQSQGIVDSYQRAQTARELEEDNNQYLTAIQGQRTAMRAYVSSANPDTLTPYWSNGDQAASILPRLQQTAGQLGLADAAFETEAASKVFQLWAEQQRLAVLKGGSPVPDVTAYLDDARAHFNYFKAASDALAAAVDRAYEAAAKEALARQQLLLWSVLVGGVLACLDVLLMGLLISRRLLRPVTQLAASARELAQGREVEDLVRTGNDEVGELSRALEAWQRSSTERLAGEARFRAIYDNVGVGIVHTDTQGAILDVNPTFCRMLGRQPEELKGHHLRDFRRAPEAHANSKHFQDLRTGRRDIVHLEQTYVRHDGRVMHAALIVSTVKDVNGEPISFIGMMEDVTEHKAAQNALRKQALHDALTGLPNRVLLRDRLQQAIVAGKRSGDPVAFFVMDVDRFKEINDTFGHHYGDRILQKVAHRLRGAVRRSDTVARMGGDEFAVVLPHVTDEAKACRLADKICRALDSPVVLDEETFHVSASIGIAVFPLHGMGADELIQRADVAMYAAKRQGGGYATYDVERDENSRMRLAMVGELRQALETDELELHYQPEVNLRTGQVSGVEALVRWLHPRQGLIAPDRFIPLAERTGLVRPLGMVLLDMALRQHNAWRRQQIYVRVGVNLSVRNLHDPELPDNVARLLDVHGVGAEWLKIEITESALMADPERALDVLNRLNAMGIRLSIDDFGTGYSSLGYLRRLPVAEIKIDKSFVIEMAFREDDAMIVRSIIDLGHNLGLDVVAEGIENEETWNMLGCSRCDTGQGYLMSRPMPADEMVKWLRRSRRAIAAPVAAEANALYLRGGLGDSEPELKEISAGS